ncbi:MAG: hypothetical protein KDC54_19925, partial [Lewinella sp.]|nr:hypothetical protein [Lewinella sp.]
VSLDQARLVFFDRLRLVNLYVEDVYGDTLLTSPRLTANFNLNPLVLLTRGLEIEALKLQGTRFNIRRATGDSLSNIQVALNRLIPPRDPSQPREPSTFTFQLRQLGLEDVQFSKSDSINGSELLVHLAEGQLAFDDIDLPRQQFRATEVFLTEPTFQVLNYNGTPLPPAVALIDSLVTAPDTLKDPLFSVGVLRIKGGQFRLDNYRRFPDRLRPLDQIDFQHLDVYDIELAMDSFQFHRDTFQAQVHRLAARERSGFQLDTLAADQVLVCPTAAQLNGMKLITPYSRIGDTLQFRYREYQGWQNFTDEVRIEAHINESDVTLSDIIAFAPGLESNAFFASNRQAELKLDGFVRGPVNRLRGEDLNIRLTDGTTLEGNFSARNLTVKGEEFLSLRLDRLRTRMRTLRQLIPRFNPPPNFNNLGRLNFSGRFDGFFVDFVANGILRTDIGRAEMDMRMDLKRGAQRANYSGNLRLIDFDLGAWSGNPDFGIVNFSSQVLNGVGLTTETAFADLTAAIQTFSFRGYTYENASLTGQLNRNFFNGDFTIQDDNIDFTFRGEIDFADTIPAFDFSADVRHLAMQQLNLSPLDLVLAGHLDLNLRNTRLSAMEGSLRARNVQLTKDQTDRYEIDSLVAFTYFDAEGEKVLRVNSDILSGEIIGSFDIDELPGSFSQFLVNNYPGFSGRLGIKPPQRVLNVNRFSYDFHLIDSKGLNWIINPKLGRLTDTYLAGRYDGANNELAVDLQLPELSFDNFRFRDIILRVDAQGSEGDLDMVVDSTYINGRPRFSTVTLLSILQGDTINFGINYRNDEPSLLDLVNLNGLFYLPDSVNYGIRFKQ